MIVLGYIKEITEGGPSYNGPICVEKPEESNTLYGQKMEIE
jgi:hypothetical protein